MLHLVTLVSETGEYGGPTGVALDFVADPPAGWVGMIASTYISRARPEVTLPSRLYRAKKLTNGSFAGTLSLSLLWRLPRLAKSYDFIHIHLGRDLVTGLGAWLVSFLRLPFAVQPHGMITPKKDFLTRIFDFLILRRVVRKAQAVFFLTEFERSNLIRVFGQHINSKLVFLPNAAPAIRNFRSSVFPLPVNEPFAMFAARLHARKRPLDFLRLAELSKNRGSNLHFLIAGPDEGEKSRIMNQIETLGLWNVTVLDGIPRAAILTIMKKALALVLPSEFEPYPLSVIEALSLGTPVVITKSCGLASIVEDQKCGAVVPVGDVDRMHEALEAISRSQEKYRALALETARMKFSREVVNKSLLVVYELSA